jgi:hypothetical protein
MPRYLGCFIQAEMADVFDLSTLPPGFQKSWSLWPVASKFNRRLADASKPAPFNLTASTADRKS